MINDFVLFHLVLFRKNITKLHGNKNGKICNLLLWNMEFEKKYDESLKIRSIKNKYYNEEYVKHLLSSE